jgi:hypothetical protein
VSVEIDIFNVKYLVALAKRTRRSQTQRTFCKKTLVKNLLM